MCDEDTVEENESYLASLTRRQFNKLAVGSAIGMMLPLTANAKSVAESRINVQTPDGVADCYFVHPVEGKHAAVIVWPDILGLRPAFESMGKRLAESGYAVLVVNPYYRSAKAPVVKEGATFQDTQVRSTVFPMYRSLSPQTHKTDALAFVAFLDSQAAVDTEKKMGTTGYCMGGPIVMRTAAAAPTRIGAGASFHGAGLVSEGPDSPHLQIPKMQAQFLIAIAQNDDERMPDAKNVLRDEYEKAGLSAEIEVYDGAMHGWCPPDSQVYHEAQAERAWRRLLVLFDGALA
jgi:carboxymethylenebutenolidase